MPDLHPIRSDDPQSATARNPVIHPKAGRRIGSFPDTGTGRKVVIGTNHDTSLAQNPVIQPADRAVHSNP
ncbi:MAG TPA: hypothetical protein P5077_09495 [bacterium]|nr:hypothetical protein [bacterium]